MSRRGKSAIQELEDAIKDQEFDLQAKGREIRGLSEQARLAQIDINMKEEVRKWRHRRSCVPGSVFVITGALTPCPLCRACMFATRPGPAFPICSLLLLKFT